MAIARASLLRSDSAQVAHSQLMSDILKMLSNLPDGRLTISRRTLNNVRLRQVISFHGPNRFYDSKQQDVQVGKV